jgi:hypothetical protein
MIHAGGGWPEKAAQAVGCKAADGGHMVEAVQDLLADFMLGR